MDAMADTEGFLAAAVRVATPLLLAATGETVAQRSGVMNLGLEGVMLTGALAAAVGAATWGPWAGAGSAVLAGLLFGALEAGAGAMQREADVPAVAVYLVEAVVIIVVLLAESARRHGARTLASPASVVRKAPG